MTRWRTPLLAIAALLCASAVLASPAFARPAAQAGGTIFIEPGDQAVPPGSEFTVRVMQNAGVPTTGAQATVGFDPSLLQIVDVQAGAPYSGSDIISPGPLGDVVAEANVTGALRCLATFYLPGTGSVDPGDQEFLLITFQALPAAAGVSPLELLEDSCVTDGGVQAQTWFGIMVDEQGSEIPVDVQNGQVRIEAGATAPTPDPAVGTASAGGTAAAGGTPAASSTRTPTSGVLGESERPDVGTTSMSVDPASLKIEKGAQFSFEVKQEVGVDTTSASVELGFSKDVVELLAIEPGEDWSGATGADEDTLSAAVEAANEEGLIKDLGFLMKAGQTVPAGETTVVKLTLRAKDVDASTAVNVNKVTFLDADGNSIEGSGNSGEIVVGSGSGGGGLSMMLIIGIVAAVIAAGAIGFFVYRKRTAWA